VKGREICQQILIILLKNPLLNIFGVSLGKKPIIRVYSSYW